MEYRDTNGIVLNGTSSPAYGTMNKAAINMGIAFFEEVYGKNPEPVFFEEKSTETKPLPRNLTKSCILEDTDIPDCVDLFNSSKDIFRSGGKI